MYDKHKVIFAAKVDATLKNLATSLKRMQSQQLASMLNDVDAAMRGGGDGPSIVLSSGTAPNNQQNMVNDFGSQKDDARKKAAEPEAEPDACAAKDNEVHGCAAKQGEENVEKPVDVEVQAEPNASTGIIPEVPPTSSFTGFILHWF